MRRPTHRATPYIPGPAVDAGSRLPKTTSAHIANMYMGRRLKKESQVLYTDQATRIVENHGNWLLRNRKTSAQARRASLRSFWLGKKRTIGRPPKSAAPNRHPLKTPIDSLATRSGVRVNSYRAALNREKNKTEDGITPHITSSSVTRQEQNDITSRLPVNGGRQGTTPEISFMVRIMTAEFDRHIGNFQSGCTVHGSCRYRGFLLQTSLEIIRRGFRNALPRKESAHSFAGSCSNHPLAPPA